MSGGRQRRKESRGVRGHGDREETDVRSNNTYVLVNGRVTRVVVRHFLGSVAATVAAVRSGGRAEKEALAVGVLLLGPARRKRKARVRP